MTSVMKAISLHQPYPLLIALDLKGHETRTWGTSYRGPLAICSAKKWDREVQARCEYFAGYFSPELAQVHWRNGKEFNPEIAKALFENSPRGSVICLADLVDCVEMTSSLIDSVGEIEREVGGWEVGRFAWRLENVRALEKPFAIKGRQRLWTLSDSEAEQVWERAA